MNPRASGFDAAVARLAKIAPEKTVETSHVGGDGVPLDPAPVSAREN